MTEQSRKKLIEVALPLESINKAGRAEKDRKTGTIRNVHKWFAPMPGPVWRALLAACILDNPEDSRTRSELLALLETLVPPDGGLPQESASKIFSQMTKITGQSTNEIVVVDPFVGGGSTIIEGQRLGLNVLGSDLNPVPTLISRTVVELYPKIPLLKRPKLDKSEVLLSQQLDCVTADLKLLAKEIQMIAYERLQDWYPNRGKEKPFAYLWAHAIPCPNPACNTRVPLFATEAISRQRGLERYLRMEVTSEPDPKFYVVDEKAKGTAPTKTSRGNFSCPRCGTGFSTSHLKQNSSSLSLVPLAVMLKEGNVRNFLGSAEAMELFAVNKVGEEIHETPLPAGGLGLSVQAYGFDTYEQMFTTRQAHAVYTFAQVVAETTKNLVQRVESKEYADFLSAMLGLAVGKLANANSKQTTWRTRLGPSKAETGFGQSVLTMVWDFAEISPFGESVGDWMQGVETSIRALWQLPQENVSGRVLLSPAQEITREFEGDKRYLIATDPPYFDAIGYADLSDFFYIWHRDALRGVFPDLYQTASVPRAEELVSDRTRHEGDEQAATDFFIEGFRKTFSGLIEKSDQEYPIIIVYAHQQREEKYGEYGSSGWEALLEALNQSKIMVTASWPIHCTNQTRLRGQGANALSAYVALICRARPENSPATDRRGFISALQSELPVALKAMQQGSIAPIDLAQASVGPGMAVYSKFSRVIESDGSDMSIRMALSIINQVLAEVLSEQEGDFDADTRFALKWFEQYEWDEGPYGLAESLSRAMMTSVSGVARSGILAAGGGKVRLLGIQDLDTTWTPQRDDRISLWEVMLHVLASLESQGESDAARQLLGASERVNISQIKELCFQLYNICTRNNWAQSALMFNNLGASWGDLLSASQRMSKSELSDGQSLFDVE